MPAEIILAGGAAIVEQYGFRDMTADIDALISASSVMKDAAKHVGEKYSLPVGRLNADIKNTSSYSINLVLYSTFYKSFSGVLKVRCVTGEYLVAMKLRAFRKYKNDISDIVGILYEHKKKGDEITRERIDEAVTRLYGSWNGFSEEAVKFIEDVLSGGDYERVYGLVRENEKAAKEKLLDFGERYPGVLKEENADAVLAALRKKKRPESNGNDGKS